MESPDSGGSDTDRVGSGFRNGVPQADFRQEVLLRIRSAVPSGAWRTDAKELTMGGISSGGLISGIDTQGLINSLIQVAARPRTLAQGRLFQLQSQQAAYVSLNGRLSSLRTATTAFRTDNVFKAKAATSSDSDVLSATASIGAQPGSYSFIVDRLVSSQQQLSRGFQDRDSSAVGAERFTFESALGRVDRDLSLNALNNGDGVVRGKIRVNDGTTTSEVDLSRAGTVNEVIDTINNSGLNVTARVRDGRFEIVGATSVTNAGNTDVAGSLGLSSASGATTSAGVLRGARVYQLNENTALAGLNDGNGVAFRSRASVPNGVSPDFRVTVGGIAVNIGLGEIRETVDGEATVLEPAVTTIGGLLDRINQSFTDAGVDAVATINEADGSLAFTSNSGNIEAVEAVSGSLALRDLGISAFTGGTGTTVEGDRIFSGLGTVLLSGLNGGGESGGIGTDGRINFTTASGATLNIELDLENSTTLEDIIDGINSDPANNGEIVASLNENGTGLRIVDTTSGPGNLIIEGAASDDTAAKLGISTGATGVDSSSFDGTSLQRRYIGEGTSLSSLRNGDGIGTGRIRLVDGRGQSAEVNIGEDINTVGELLTQLRSSISSSQLNLSVSINEQGDGLLITDTSGTGSPIQISDVDGVVAKNLRIAGTSEAGGAENFIDGSFETTIEFDPTDTLDDIVTAINDSEAGVAVSILNDGSGTRPFRLSLTSRDSGTAGRFLLDTNGFDIGLTTLDEGSDARVIFGSNNAASGILLTSSTNTLDNVVTGLTIDLKNTSDTPVTVSVTDDTSGVESAINTFIEAYNGILTSIENSTKFDQDTGERGVLLGDGLLLGLRRGLFGAIQGTNRGFNSSVDRLTEVGISIGGEGRLEFDREEFRQALIDDPEGVEALFTRRLIDDDATNGQDLPDGVTSNDPNARDVFSELGVLGQIEEFTKNYVDSIDGILTSRTNSLDTQILSQQRRIDSLTAGLDRERIRLERQFVGMEQALAQLQSQQAALGSLTSFG